MKKITLILIAVSISFIGYLGYQSRSQMQHPVSTSQQNSTKAKSPSVEAVTQVEATQNIKIESASIGDLNQDKETTPVVEENELVKERAELHQNNLEKKKLAIAMLNRNLAKLETELVKAEAEGDAEQAKLAQIRIERLYRQMDEVRQ